MVTCTCSDDVQIENPPKCSYTQQNKNAFSQGENISTTAHPLSKTELG